MRQNTIQLGSSSALPQGAGTGLGIVLLEDMYSTAYAFAPYGHIRHGERPPPPRPPPHLCGPRAWEEKERGFTVTCPSPSLPLPTNVVKTARGKGHMYYSVRSSLLLHCTFLLRTLNLKEGGRNRRGDGECTFYNIGGSMTCSGTHTAVTLIFGT